jgi:hypothetical protein
MPTFTFEPASTVRQHSPWLLPKLVYGAVFVAVALSAYGWKSFNCRPPTMGTLCPTDAAAQATARVCIHHPNFAFQAARQEVLAQAKPEIAENLQIDGRASGQQTLVAISLSRLREESLVPLVNAVAAAYVQACRTQWKREREESYSAAQETARESQRRVFEAQMQFELLRDRRLRSPADSSPVALPQPTTVENPRWTEASRRLAELEGHKAKLLLKCTPLHPSVRDIESQLAAVRFQMASIQPRIVTETPGIPQPNPIAGVPEAAEIAAAQHTAEQLGQELLRAQSGERAALAARGAELQIDLVDAEPPPAAPSSWRSSAAVIGSAFATAMASIVALGMICRGASWEPLLTSVAELQSLLPAPVVGVIPADPEYRVPDPGRRPASANRRAARWAWMAAGLAILLALAWVFFRG